MPSFLLISVVLVEVSVVIGSTEAKPYLSSSSSRVVGLDENKESFKRNECGLPRPVLHYIGKFNFLL